VGGLDGSWTKNAVYSLLLSCRTTNLPYELDETKEADRGIGGDRGATFVSAMSLAHIRKV
jgi:hypothetical protein